MTADRVTCWVSSSSSSSSNTPPADDKPGLPFEAFEGPFCVIRLICSSVMTSASSSSAISVPIRCLKSHCDLEDGPCPPREPNSLLAFCTSGPQHDSSNVSHIPCAVVVTCSSTP